MWPGHACNKGHMGLLIAITVLLLHSFYHAAYYNVITYNHGLLLSLSKLIESCVIRCAFMTSHCTVSIIRHHHDNVYKAP